MTKRSEPNRRVMLNLGLMKIRLVSASDLFFLLSADAPFIPAPAGRQAQDGVFRCDLNKFAEGGKMRKAEIGVALVLMLIGFLILADAIRLGFGWGMSGPKAGFFPFYMGLGVVICASLVLFKGIQKFKKEGPGKRLIPIGGLKPVLWVLLPSTFMVIVTELVGLHMAALLFLVFYMRVIGKINWAIVIPVSVIVPLTIYTLFEKVFLIPLPSGLFGDTLMPF